MSYDARETSAHSGEPVELYRFAQGVDVWTSTSSDMPVISNAETYTPAHVVRGPIRQGQERSAGGVELELSKDYPVAALYQLASPSVPVWLTVFRFHYGDDDFRALLVGQLAFPVWNGPTLKLSVLPITALMARPVLVHKWQPRCNHTLGAGDGARGCNVDLEAFKVHVVAVSQVGRVLTANELASKPDGYFAGGKVVRASGEAVMIRSHEATTVELSRPLLGVGPGEELDAYPGCCGSLEVCSGVFGNVVEHGGDPFGPDRNPHVSGLN